MTTPKPRKPVGKPAKPVVTPTARDKAVSTATSNAANQKDSTDKLTLEAKITDLNSQIVESDKRIAWWETQISTLKKSASPQTYKTAEAGLATEQGVRSGLITQRKSLTELQKANADVAEAVAAALAKKAADKVTDPSSTGGGSKQKPSLLPLTYNASAVKEMYFSSRASFLSEMKIAGNQPSAVQAATNLWNTVNTSKGMIVTAATTLEAWASGAGPMPKGAANYGFQFMYNPGTVAMTYYTSPNVDVTLMTSGQEMFNLAGVAGSQGSVSFQLVLNRTFDMQYFDSNGSPKGGWSNAYTGRKPTASDMSEIWNKGTMYDVEYLLRTIMGTTMSSYLRGFNTADMGWLPATPVELHLGKSLRYLVTVNNISVNHVIFNENMVPIFTTVDIGLARLPDYPPANVGTLA